MKVLNNIIAITYYKFRRNIWMSTKSLQSKIKNNLYWETHDRMFNIKEPIKNRLIDSIKPMRQLIWRDYIIDENGIHIIHKNYKVSSKSIKII